MLQLKGNFIKNIFTVQKDQLDNGQIGPYKLQHAFSRYSFKLTEFTARLVVNKREHPLTLNCESCLSVVS